MGIVVFSLVAKEDLKNIFYYIKMDSLLYARKEVNAIKLYTHKLKSIPYLEKKFEKYDNELIRELVFKSYRIIYEILEDKIVILTIHHHARSIHNNSALSSDNL